MKKAILLLILFSFLLVPSAFSQVNLDFTMNLEKEIYFPNEEIKVEINVINRDLQFGAKDALLSMQIGDRFYDFKLGDIKPDAKFTEVITLPRFTPGSKTIRGTLNYTFFGERWTKETYNGFEVAYPPIERYPRNVNVIGFDLPDKLIAGKEYEVKVTVKNEGSVGGDMLVEVASLEEFVDKEIRLEPGETETISLTVKFINPEVSLIEARIYTLINGEKYLLHYSGKKAYLEEEKKAKLSIDRIAYVGESDKEINQKDEVDIKIYLKNDGNYAAAEVKGTLSSSEDKINITKSTLDYVLIPAGDVSAPENEYFRIKTNDVEAGKHTLNLEVSYLDSEQRKIVFEIPVDVKEGGDSCSKDNDCEYDEVCSNKKCQEVACTCGEVRDRRCIKYECCSDSNCDDISTCNIQIHKCIERSGCLKVLDNGNPQQKLDIVFIGDGYDTNRELKEDVMKIIDLNGDNGYYGLISVEPYKSNKHKINIWILPTGQSIPYNYNSWLNQEQPDFGKAMEIAAKCTAADYHLIVSKRNYRSYCYFGGPCFNSVGSPLKKSAGRLILHEFGHGFGRLADEYVEPRLGDRSKEPNCAPDMQTAQTWWGDLVGGKVGFFEGCSYTNNNVRPTQNSIMRSHYQVEDTYYPVNERHLNKLLQQYR